MDSSKYADPQPEQAPAAAPPPLEPETSSVPAFNPADADADEHDAFAQTRQAEDLFFDEFTPVTETIVIPARPAEGSEQSNGQRRESRGQNERRGGRGRGGRSKPVAQEPKPEAEPESAKQPVKEKPKDTGAVKGDRSGTGGVRKPKLTEDELSQRLANIKLKNKELEEAHRRAEADEASFRAREQIAQAKIREEKQNRQVLEGEREQNRQRKLKALQGREWDAEKKEEDYAQERSRGSQFRRGAYGGVTHDPEPARSSYGADEGQYYGDNYAPRGGRGRGNFRGGRGRGGRHNGGQRESPAPNRPEKDQQPPAPEDFPALPGSNPEAQQQKPAEQSEDRNKPSSHAPEAPKSIPLPDSAEAAKGTWAEQVEAGMPVTPAAT